MCMLIRTRWPALAIHGDKQQGERDWVLQQFKSGQSTILVATDVAARGEAHVYMPICIRLVWLCSCWYTTRYEPYTYEHIHTSALSYGCAHAGIRRDAGGDRRRGAKSSYMNL